MQTEIGEIRTLCLVMGTVDPGTGVHGARQLDQITEQSLLKGMFTKNLRGGAWVHMYIFKLEISFLNTAPGHKIYPVTIGSTLLTIIKCCHTNKRCIYIYINARLGTSAAQVTHCYSRRLPALERFYRETKFSLLQSTHST